VLLKTYRNKFSLSAFSAFFVVLLVLTPLLLILSNGGKLEAERWSNLWGTRAPELLWQTVKLAVAVALVTTILGVSAAWISTRYRFKGSGIIVWLLVLPLAIPTYVYADIYIRLLSENGWLYWLAQFWNEYIINSWLLKWVSSVWAWLTGDSDIVSQISDLIATCMVLSLAGFSYVFLLVRAALIKSTQSLEEAAYIHGATASEVFWRVNVPMLRPAIAASLAIVVLHTISDFGAVRTLQYETFTTEIYRQYSRNRADLSLPAALSVILVVMAFSFLVIERFFRSRQRYFASGKAIDRRYLKELTGIKLVFAWSWIGLIVFFSVFVPVALIVTESIVYWASSSASKGVWVNALNSFVMAAVVATVALVLAFPIAYYHTRKRNMMSGALMHFSNVGFVLPGPVVAIGTSVMVLMFFGQMVTALFLLAWVIAVVIRYLPLATQSQESALQQLTPSTEQAGRILGASPLQNMKRVVIPIIKPGVISAWVLVFIDALKELPAALVLGLGYETLPVVIFHQANEEMMEAAAPAALMLLIASLPALWLLMRGNRNQLASSL